MSVGTCAHLYQPEEAFDANTFESWVHSSQWRYQSEPEPEPEKELPNDYVPEYSWFKAATEQLRIRCSPKQVLKACSLFRMAPLRKEELEFDEEDAFWDPEACYARSCIMQSFQLIEEAKKCKKLTYKEHAKYAHQVQDSVRELVDILNPPKKPALRLVPRSAKKK